MLRYMGSQRVGQDWATELNCTELKYKGDGELVQDIKLVGYLFSTLRIFLVMADGLGKSHCHLSEEHTWENMFW